MDRLERGRALLRSGQAAEAAECLMVALDELPDDAAALTLLAQAYYQDNKILEALHAYDRIISLDAATADTWRETGNALADLGEHAQAIGALKNSLAMDDCNPETQHNYARACYRMGDLSRTAAHLERSIQLCDSIESWQSLATIIPTLPEADHQRILDVRRSFARKLADFTGVAWPTEEDRVPLSRRKGPWRVGYVSAFFHNANYTKPVWGLINHHDRSRFRVVLFSDSVPDAGMPGYQPRDGDEVHDIRALDNPQLSALIRSSDIDVLVDLGAYSHEPRLSLFLSRAAPVTIAWWAMYATSGLPGIDYLIGDDQMIKAGEEAYFDEQLVRLAVSYMTFTVDYPVPPVVPPPCVEQGFFCFWEPGPAVQDHSRRAGCLVGDLTSRAPRPAAPGKPRSEVASQSSICRRTVSTARH